MILRSRNAKIIFAALLCFVLAHSGTVRAQGSTLFSSSSNDAIALAQQAIALMGGQGWARVGSASATTTITDPKGRTYSAARSDDWSKGYGRRRSDFGKSASVTTMETQAVRYTVKGSKITTIAAANYDLVGLAEFYPAAALRLALARPQCTFKVLTSTDSGDDKDVGAVRMNCVPMNSFGRDAVIDWWFDASGMPKQVRVPISSTSTGFHNNRTVQFVSFQQVSGLTVPAKTQTGDSGYVLSTTVISDVSFQDSFPDSKFSIQTTQK